jgi:hypothetical protein
VSSDSSPPSDPLRRRGRPQQFPYDPAPMEAEHVAVQQRVSWLLATSRLLSGNPSLASREDFLQQLHARGLVVDSTRISRWESGDHRVRDNVVEAYESILGLPKSSIVALTANLRRASGIDQEVTDHDHDDGVLDDLFDRAMHHTLTGSDWLSLATRISGFERFYVTPEVRTTLCDTLLAELQLSVGHAQVTRTAAANLAIGNLSFRRQMSRSLGAHILSSDAQVFRPAMLVLRHVNDDSVSDLALRLMSNERPVLARAAASVVAMKLSEGRYAGESLLAVERHILQGIGASVGSSRWLVSLDLVARLPADSFARIWPHIIDRRLRRRVQLARETGELEPPEVTHDVVHDVARVTQAATLARFTQEPDQMLIRLVREALFHVRHQRRAHASQLLGASPYRSALVGACLDLVGEENAFVAARAWDVLHRFGPIQGTDLVDRALDETRHEPQIRALIAVGTASGRLSESDAARLAAVAWDGLPDVQHAATYALGMTGSTEVERLLEHTSPHQREAAAWWLRLGPAVTDQTSAEPGVHAVA